MRDSSRSLCSRSSLASVSMSLALDETSLAAAEDIAAPDVKVETDTPLVVVPLELELVVVALR